MRVSIADAGAGVGVGRVADALGVAALRVALGVTMGEGMTTGAGDAVRAAGAEGAVQTDDANRNRAAMHRRMLR